jgi:phosphatidylserine/phosphatidylglycerophosphate/cardiolipin synthase-like enzyme
MAKFLTTTGTSYHIENIILGATKELYLVSPYLQISKTLLERLKDASQSGVNIKIVYGKNQLKDDQLNNLKRLKNTQLYFSENLHAKCYFSESQMVITSMNMYEFSEKNNREMGIFIERSNDKELFVSAVKETLSIIDSAEFKKSNNYVEKEATTYSKPAVKKVNIHKGFCSRCEDEIKNNPERPYCAACFSSWNEWQNYDYIENVCHKCGKEENTTIQKPECYKCFKSN